ncbi:MAG: DUF4276 family protein [Streptosporangiaceae bacterium]|nr:DUF4276 family protein [Streptosporangiaceae bacterium]
MIASVVEGHGEVYALPKLLHRIASEFGTPLITPKPPMRRPRSKLVAPGGIENAVEAKASEITGTGGVLVLVDADDSCPAELGPQLLARACEARPDKRVSVVLAKKEFEAWLLAAASSIAGYQGLPPGFTFPGDPEAVRDAKGQLSRARTDGHPYSPTVDQAPLVSVLDVTTARDNSPSFDKFCRDVAWLLGAS